MSNDHLILKVALTGTHGVGKTYIVDNVAAMAMNEGWNTEIIYSPTREIKALGQKYGMATNWDGSSWQFQLHVTSAMQMGFWRAERAVVNDPTIKVGQPTLIIADRCLWDPLAYTWDLYGRSRVSDDDLEARFQLSNMMEIGESLARSDTFFDQVFFKPHHPDHLDADPDRLDDREYQIWIEDAMTEMLWPTPQEGAKTYPPRDDVHVLDKDRDRAVEEVWEWARNEAQARMVSA